MIPKALPLVLASFALVSCGQDWQIARGPIERPGSSWGQSAEDDPGEAASEDAPAPVVSQPRRPGNPAPITGNPFDVPDVTSKLPGERDLKPGGPTPVPVPVEPEDPDGPTIRATPGDE